MSSTRHEQKSLSTALLLFSLVMVTNGLAYAACTHSVDRSGGTIDITSDCDSSFTQTKVPNIVRNPDYLNDLENNYLDHVNNGLQNFKDHTADESSTQDKENQIADDSKEKEQEAIDAQRIKQQDEEAKLEDSKH